LIKFIWRVLIYTGATRVCKIELQVLGLCFV